MFRVRTTISSSGNTAVQVVYRHHHKTDIVKHIGTAKTENQKKQLITLAYQYIARNIHTPPLLPEAFANDLDNDTALVSLNSVQFTASYHYFAYEFLSHFYALNGFDRIQCALLRDLVFMRIIEPCSKLHAVELLKEYFAISYPINRVYEGLRTIRLLKEETENIAVSYATKYLGFDFSLVFYDVTTLYFETFTNDADIQDTEGNITVGLRKPGFSKDNKPQQPQIIIGLLVNGNGYPIAVHMFSGKTFEGHTILPVIKTLTHRYGIEHLTIVADAAMLSLDTIENIEEEKLHYIVGARLGNVSFDLLKKISEKLNKTEGIYYQTNTHYGNLICDYSEKRATKDRFDRKKQLQKAQYQIDNPDKVKRKTRFVREETKAKLTLNQELIEKDELKEGVKGYYTNLILTETLTEQNIVQKYKDLWQVEKSFRIAKSDLQARPIFHHKKESIEAHIVIVFVSLCIAKSIELTTGYSIKKVRDMIWKILDIELFDTITDRVFIKRMETTGNKMAEFFERLKRVDNFSKRVLKK